MNSAFEFKKKVLLSVFQASCMHAIFICFSSLQIKDPLWDPCWLVIDKNISAQLYVKISKYLFIFLYKRKIFSVSKLTFSDNLVN